MKPAAEESADNVTELPVAGPGERLRAARVAAGLDKERVAAQLHLKPGQVDELERDHYDSFAARVFVRGYLRNYARLVGLPVDSVLGAFDALCPTPDEPELKRVGSHKPQVSSRHGLVRLVSWLLLLGILGLFGVWWSGYLELNGTPESPVQPLTGSQNSSQAPTLPLVESGGETSLALPPPPEGQDRTEQPEPENAVPASDPRSDVVLPPVSSESVSPVAAEPASPAPRPSPGTDAAEILLSLDGNCWVEIRALDGSYKLVGEFQAGTRRVLGGNPPYRILLGNAAMATLTVNGKPYDLQPHTRQEIARFTLDPAVQ